MNNLSDTKQLILALKQVKVDRGLNIDDIVRIVSDADPQNAPSRSSIARVFAERSEDDASHFRFDVTLKPICNALLDIDTVNPDESADDLALKSLVRYKKDLLEEYARQLKEAREELKTVKEKERNRYNEKIEKESKQFHDSLAFAMEQIKLKDARIDELLSVNRENSATIKEIVATNNKLVAQMMSCPLKKE